MANFGPKDIKRLREMTDAGMMDCKQALSASDGDMDQAVDWLRKKGLGAAAKKAGKVAAEGTVAIKLGTDKVILGEINSQTDFVAQNDKFKAFVAEVMEHAYSNNLFDADAVNNSQINGESFEEYMSLQTATIGEKLVARRFAALEANDTTAVNGYVHANGKVGVIVSAECDSSETVAAVTATLKDISMHAAAMSPKYLDESQIDASVIDKEKEIAREQLLKEGKPEAILEKIIPGKIKRFLQDNTLIAQKFVMDDKFSVSEHLSKVAKETNGTAKLVGYVRFTLGDGIEVEEEDFAAEVAKQMA